MKHLYTSVLFTLCKLLMRSCHCTCIPCYLAKLLVRKTTKRWLVNNGDFKAQMCTHVSYILDSNIMTLTKLQLYSIMCSGICACLHVLRKHKLAHSKLSNEHDIMCIYMRTKICQVKKLLVHHPKFCRKGDRRYFYLARASVYAMQF